MLIDAQVNMLFGQWALPNAEDIRAKLQSRLEAARAAGQQIIQVLNDPEEGWPLDQFDPVFKPEDSDIVIWKSTFSVFESNPEFAATLEALGIDELEVIGMQSELCLRSSVIDALKENFKVTVEPGMHFTYNSDDKGFLEVAAEVQRELEGLGAKS
ncbi:MAG: cysteine hydrolase family protein [Micrococcales bacterium]